MGDGIRWKNYSVGVSNGSTRLTRGHPKLAYRGARRERGRFAARPGTSLRPLSLPALRLVELGQVRERCSLVARLRILENTRLPVDQVAEHIGFSDAASFHRSFRKWTEIHPACIGRE
ncbi:helix-turn-helix domain-containing protein [Paraburkholderia sediminicola]|uniref:helix-turn-helix domain-containing protein n=1 Tax=Paraburkholderia sediminicola TaxID=458836 RepID=UPI0038B8C65E